MRRIAITPRPDWLEKVESVGLTYHTINDAIYWDESAYYAFTSSEVDTLDDATAELHGMCLKAVEHVIANKLFSRMAIPEGFVPLILRSWEDADPSMYGRFDFCYDGTGDPKLLEYNADTPTALLEGSVVQWFWLKDLFPSKDQFNSIHEKLLDFWTAHKYAGTVYFACMKDTEEDLGNIEYMRDVAMQAGLRTKQVFIEDIGWLPDRKQFVDLDNESIFIIFKLYPWEWMFTDEFGSNLMECDWTVIEPAWKAILSNKAILPILWELYPDHPNLLPAFFENTFSDNYVRKPFFSREGDSVLMVRGGETLERPGTYGKEGYIFQQYHPVPVFDGNYVSIGSWIIDGKPAGIGIREDNTEITMNTSRFIPHLFEEE
ncbi:MAG TPA: glutathionylspermidine synthase family protein [Spirochaetota bacterium]|nr:glutathionylspermidine synthase family protein [Spirochaetota bacterium]HNT12522.1 glutathionylspermidine synthase family protein [Spirochaetota bacterium]